MQAAFGAHRPRWLLDAASADNLDGDGQPTARALLMYVTEDLGAFADTLPVGLLTLHPAMRPT